MTARSTPRSSFRTLLILCGVAAAIMALFPPMPRPVWLAAVGVTLAVLTVAVVVAERALRHLDGRRRRYASRAVSVSTLLSMVLLLVVEVGSVWWLKPGTLADMEIPRLIAVMCFLTVLPGHWLSSRLSPDVSAAPAPVVAGGPAEVRTHPVAAGFGSLTIVAFLVLAALVDDLVVLAAAMSWTGVTTWGLGWNVPTGTSPPEQLRWVLKMLFPGTLIVALTAAGRPGFFLALWWFTPAVAGFVSALLGDKACESSWFGLAEWLIPEPHTLRRLWFEQGRLAHVATDFDRHPGRGDAVTVALLAFEEGRTEVAADLVRRYDPAVAANTEDHALALTLGILVGAPPPDGRVVSELVDRARRGIGGVFGLSGSLEGLEGLVAAAGGRGDAARASLRSPPTDWGPMHGARTLLRRGATFALLGEDEVARAEWRRGADLRSGFASRWCSALAEGSMKVSRRADESLAARASTHAVETPATTSHRDEPASP